MRTIYLFDFCNVLLYQALHCLRHRHTSFPTQSFFLFAYISNYIIPFNPHFHNRIFRCPVLVHACIPPAPMIPSSVGYPNPVFYQKDMPLHSGYPPFINHMLYMLPIVRFFWQVQSASYFLFFSHITSFWA